MVIHPPLADAFVGVRHPKHAIEDQLRPVLEQSLERRVVVAAAFHPRVLDGHGVAVEDGHLS